MSATAVTFRWDGRTLETRDDCDVQPATVDAADSWLVTEGSVLALDLHRRRFSAALPPDLQEQLALDAFWEAVIRALPRTGDWFPRVELRTQLERPHLLFRLREAPPRSRTIVLATHRGRDPRRVPRVKGPDLEAMVRLRTAVQGLGADEAVVLTPEGWIAEGTTSAIAWWVGDALAIPHESIARVDSVTVKTVLALAAATGVDVLHEEARPEDLEGREVWALNALHGIRIATSWIDGPSTAEQPGRLAAWRGRLDALRRPLPSAEPGAAA